MAGMLYYLLTCLPADASVEVTKFQRARQLAVQMEDEWKTEIVRLEAEWNSEIASLLALLEQKYKC
jgi:hypothetical protein